MAQSREEHLAKRKAYREAHKDKIKAYAARPEVKARQREWNQKNKGKRVDYYRAYQAKHREKANRARYVYRQSARGQAYYKEYYERYRTNPANRMVILVRSSLSRARASGMEFDLRLKSILKASPPLVCACCKRDFDFRVGVGRSHGSPSLDRRDNSKGYTLENTCVICWGCNSLKNDATIEDLENILAYMRGSSVRAEASK